MTEYDYSPAAYERYIAQQTRVSNWVNDTVQQAPYSNPFVLSPALRDRSFYDQPDDDPSLRYRPTAPDEWSNGSSRPSRTRSRSYVDHGYYNDRAAPSRYRSQSHSRSTSAPRDVYPQYSYPPPNGRATAPRIHTSPPHNYQYPSPNGQGHSPTRQAFVTQPPPGQIYHISPNAPPAGKGHPSHVRHPSSKPPPQPYLLVQGGGPKAEYKRGVRISSLRVLVSVLIVLVVTVTYGISSPPIHAPVPTRPHTQQQPLLKRLLGFVTMSPVGGRSGNNRGFRY